MRRASVGAGMRSAGLAVIVVVAAFAGRTPDLDYGIRLDGRDLVVDLRFKLSTAGTHRIVLPSSYGGIEDLWTSLTEPELIDSDRKLEVGERPFLRLLRTSGPAIVHLRYRVRAVDGEVSRELRFRPIIASTYMHLVGNAWIVRPHWPDLEKRNIALRWTLPDHWAIGNSFGEGKRQQRLRASIRELQGGLYVAGDFRLLRSEVRGRPVVTALRGTFGSSDDEFRAVSTRIISAQRRLWADDDFPFYFVSILPINIPMGHTTGIGRTNGFAAFLAAGRKIDDGVLYLLSHELLHTWIPGRLRLSDSGLSPELFWFTEGFTDYFANALLLIEGVKPFDWFVGAVNDKLRAYAENPARNWPNRRAGEEYHRDRNASALAYERGMLVALSWNAAIRRASGGKASLSHVMRGLRRQSKALSAATIAEEARGLGVREPEADILQWIERGQTIELQPDALGPCADRDGTVFRVRPGVDTKACAAWFR